MSRMIEIERRLSMLAEKHRHIVYLVTEDRNILQSVFAEMADTLKSFLQESIGGNTGKMLQAANSDSFYRTVSSNGILADAYEVFQLKERSYIPEGIFHGDSHGEDGAHSMKWKLPQAYPVFFQLSDFHIIRESVSAHFLKQFLLAAENEEKEHRRFVLLFLVSPVLKIPEGFESEIEIIDVPEMDEEDIEEYLLSAAAKEYSGDGFAAKQWRKDGFDPVDKKRICEAARDFRGISRKGLMEVTADLQAEFGSFFGRMGDAAGTEENLRNIMEARKRQVVELKKNEALHDATVTMKEPKDAVAGLDAFLSWLGDVKEEFLDAKKAHSMGNEPPKGVLLTGIPGSGKTQAAKKAAAVMGGLEGNVPLVQFRMDNLLGGLVGDSEANFKRCRKRIEALAPCIVLIDEIEKTFDMESKSGNNDVKMNILTALLDWMQENKKQIFFFATSNSVAHLRPELLRDGRFDMRFCVFMPTYGELVDIFCLHMEEANRRAGGDLFEDFDYREMAGAFLHDITQYAKEDENHEKNMFYTGANVENLITQANRRLRKEMEQKKKKGPFSKKAYQNALLETAKGKYSQPYGVTNMKDIAEFWLSAYENQYTNAGGTDLFPFSAFDADQCDFREGEVFVPANEYDAYMFRRISAEIKRYGGKWKERRGND